MSHIREITTALSAISVSYTNELSQTITVVSYDISAIGGSVPAANLPVRLLGTVRGTSSAQLGYVSAGVSDARISHSVSELTLIELVGLSRLQDEWCDTMRYMDALMTILQANRNIYAKSEITDANCTRGVFEYPEGSNEQFYGCQTIINITEYQ